MAEQEPETVNLEELTLKELKEEIVKLGMLAQDAETFSTKASLIVTINTFKVQQTVGIVESPKQKKSDDANYDSKAQRMYEVLEKQPFIRIKLPLDIGGKEKVGVVREVMHKNRREFVHVSGAVKSVILNGYKTLIPKGEYVEVRQQIADTLAESEKATSEAGRHLLLDRIDPETGQNVRDVLS